MHSIKHQARRDAKLLIPNPFSRPLRPTQRTTSDIPAASAVVDADSQSIIEGRRRPHSLEDGVAFSHPPKAATAPASSGKTDSDRITTTERPEDAEISALAPVYAQARRKKRRRYEFWRPEIAAETKETSPRITFESQIRTTFLSWMSLLLFFVPAGFAVNYTRQSPVTVFVVNFFAILPANALLSYGVDQFSMYIGDASGGLLTNAFSNAVQLISSIFLLRSRQIQILRSSLLGAILQNLLLMTGLAMFVGGLRRPENRFKAAIAQTMAMFLFLAVLSLTVPTVSQLLSESTEAGLRSQSRGSAIVIIVSYVLWLIFQLKTHRQMFEEPGEKTPARPSTRKHAGEATRGIAVMGASAVASSGGAINSRDIIGAEKAKEDDEKEIPQLTRAFSLAVIVLATTLLAFNTQFATDSIQGIMEQHQISTTFMGIVILPLLSNEPNTIMCGLRDKMDLALTLTLDRSMQTALLVVPIIILIAWGLQIDEMTLDFDPFPTAVAFASIIILTYVIQEGSSNWLTGALLVKAFVLLGLASFYIV